MEFIQTSLAKRFLPKRFGRPFKPVVREVATLSSRGGARNFGDEIGITLIATKFRNAS